MARADPRGGAHAACMQGERRNARLRVVVCVECGIASGPIWRRWQAHRVDEPLSLELPALAFYCPVCAFAEFGPQRRSEQEEAG